MHVHPQARLAQQQRQHSMQRLSRLGGSQAAPQRALAHHSAVNTRVRSLPVPHSGYHFDGSPRRFFEGWYWKLTDPVSRDSFALIYSVEDPGRSDAQHAGVGVQVRIFVRVMCGGLAERGNVLWCCNSDAAIMLYMDSTQGSQGKAQIAKHCTRQRQAACTYQCCSQWAPLATRTPSNDGGGVDLLLCRSWAQMATSASSVAAAGPFGRHATVLSWVQPSRAV